MISSNKSFEKALFFMEKFRSLCSLL